MRGANDNCWILFNKCTITKNYFHLPSTPTLPKENSFFYQNHKKKTISKESGAFSYYRYSNALKNNSHFSSRKMEKFRVIFKNLTIHLTDFPLCFIPGYLVDVLLIRCLLLTGWYSSWGVFIDQLIKLLRILGMDKKAENLNMTLQTHDFCSFIS